MELTYFIYLCIDFDWRKVWYNLIVNSIFFKSIIVENYLAKMVYLSIIVHNYYKFIIYIVIVVIGYIDR